MGKLLIEGINQIGSPLFKEVRGRGLFIGIEIRSDSNVDGKDFAKKLYANGLITKATHDTTCRLTPALVINKSEVEQALEIIAKSTRDLEKYN